MEKKKSKLFARAKNNGRQQFFSRRCQNSRKLGLAATATLFYNINIWQLLSILAPFCCKCNLYKNYNITAFYFPIMSDSCPVFKGLSLFSYARTGKPCKVKRMIAPAGGLYQLEPRMPPGPKSEPRNGCIF